jgi:ankyrin repeat protein
MRGLSLIVIYLTETINFLLNKSNLTSRDKYDRTVFHVAAFGADPDIVKQMLHTGRINIDAKDEDGR